MGKLTPHADVDVPMAATLKLDYARTCEPYGIVCHNTPAGWIISIPPPKLLYRPMANLSALIPILFYTYCGLGAVAAAFDLQSRYDVTFGEKCVRYISMVVLVVAAPFKLWRTWAGFHRHIVIESDGRTLNLTAPPDVKFASPLPWRSRRRWPVADILAFRANEWSTAIRLRLTGGRAGWIRLGSYPPIVIQRVTQLLKERLSLWADA